MGWVQLEFDFTVKKKRGTKNRQIDYEAIYREFLKGPLTFAQIEQLSGVSHSGVAQVITTLSLRYPVWSPKRGVYKLTEKGDY